MRDQPALSDVLIAGLSKGLNLKECRHFKPKKQELLQTHWMTMSVGSRIVNVWILLDIRFGLYLLHLAHSDLSHIAPTFWSNSSSGNKLSSWSNTSRNSRPAWRSYKQLIRDSSSLGEHHSSAVLNPKSQNPPQNHSPYPYLSSVTSPQTKNTTQHLPFTTFHQNPVFQQQQTAS